MRAVHIEATHALEADAFICAYQRFVSSRGMSKEIYSDNGTNFTGAKQELRESTGAIGPNQSLQSSQNGQHSVVI